MNSKLRGLLGTRALFEWSIFAIVVGLLYFTVGLPGIARPSASVSRQPGSSPPQLDQQSQGSRLETATFACG